jgi:PadR family transcriptional regulator PadR
MLMRLSDRGFLEHKWLPSEEAGKPPRHVYRLNAAGMAHAREQFELGAEAGVRPTRSLSRA